MKRLLFSCVTLIFGVASLQASQQYDDLVKLVKSGASEEVIIASIDASDSSYNLTSDQIVQLRGYGASPHVIITAMKHKGPFHKFSQSTQPAPTETTSVMHPASSPPYGSIKSSCLEERWEREIGIEQRIRKDESSVQLDVAGTFPGHPARSIMNVCSTRQHGIVVEGNYFPGYTDWVFSRRKCGVGVPVAFGKEHEFWFSRSFCKWRPVIWKWP